MLQSYSFLMFGFIFDCLIPLFHIEIVDFWASFVHVCWKIFENMDTRLKRSTTFHPQIDVQTEVVNRIVVNLLRGYYGKHPKSWYEHLEYIQHAYNREIHSFSNKSLFETCFGYLQPSPFNGVFG